MKYFLIQLHPKSHILVLKMRGDFVNRIRNKIINFIVTKIKNKIVMPTFV
jgi:hypothetical protein